MTMDVPHIAKVLTFDEARRIAVNGAKMEERALGRPGAVGQPIEFVPQRL